MSPAVLRERSVSKHLGICLLEVLPLHADCVSGKAPFSMVNFLPCGHEDMEMSCWTEMLMQLQQCVSNPRLMGFVMNLYDREKESGNLYLSCPNLFNWY